MRRAALAAIGFAALSVGLCHQGERLMNRHAEVDLPQVGERARTLHERSTVVDLHADSLLLRRDLLSRSGRGHVDLPRLREGGVALQVFGAPTVMPWTGNFERTDGDDLDAIPLAGFLQWTPLAWRDPHGRALWMAEKLHDFAAASQGGLLVLRDRANLAELARRRANGEAVVGALLGIEGAHAADGSAEKLEALFDAGYRMVGLTHFFDNDYAGSAHGLEKGGLTPLGRETLRRMESLGMTLDLAHLSPAAIDEALALVTRPVVVSHGGAQGTCPGPRNLSDAQLRAIAANGGVVGIGYFEGVVCGETPRHVARAIRYTADLIGDAHVALGSDYDGGTTVGFDTSELPALTQAMLDEGLTEASVGRILGANAWRVLAANLPGAPAEEGER